MAGPIRPEDVVAKKMEAFPDAVFDAFNELIIEKMVGNSAVIRKADVVQLMVKKGLKQKEIYDKGWLDIEELYRAVGWKVEYNQPVQQEEPFFATFTFTKPSHK